MAVCGGGAEMPSVDDRDEKTQLAQGGQVFHAPTLIEKNDKKYLYFAFYSISYAV
jgi:hypothetical protein